MRQALLLYEVAAATGALFIDLGQSTEMHTIFPLKTPVAFPD